MAQHDYVISNGTGAAVRSDLNNALLAIVSQNSGATEPTTTYAYQWWADTTTGLLKIRNSANNAWITLRELDGTLTIEDGTVSAPGLAFRDDLNTGIWRPGTDQFAISTNGVERVEWGTSEVVFNDGGTNYDFRVEGDNNANLLFVDASADAVGIGTSSPGELLHISGASNPSVQLTATNDTTPKINWATNGTDRLEITSSSVVGASINVRSNQELRFGTNNTERVRITNGGNVGIGTTTAGRTLSVNGDIQISNSTSGWGTGNGFEFVHSGDGESYIINRRDANMRFHTNNTERARLTASGQWLVGTSSARSVAGLTPELEVETANGFPSFSITANSTTAGQEPRIVFGRSKGSSVGSNTVVASGDSLGSIRFAGADGSNLNSTAAAIGCEVDGTPGAGDMPGRLVFSTTADGASSPTERLRINQAGHLLLDHANVREQGSASNFSQFGNNTTLFPNIEFYAKNTSYASSIQQNICARGADSAYNFLIFYSGNAADVETVFRGNGNNACDGSWTGGGADYAEYFEWSDSNPNEEDRRGISVVLDGEKIREAVAGEDPIGVISGNPSVVGDAAWNKWSGKYLRDEFGTYIQEDYEVINDEGETVVQQSRKLNPAYDPDQEYISREQRPEWDCVGLMGKLRIRKGQVTGSRWIKMRDISDSVEEWLVR